MTCKKVKNNWHTYCIDTKVLEEENNLVELILNTEAFDHWEETQKNLDLLITASEENKKQLFDILEKERVDLLKIQEDYEKFMKEF